MILLSAIELQDCTAAYNWHRGFAGANDALYPRNFDDFEQLVMEGSVWAARSTDLDYLAHAYASFDEQAKVMEIGGLMVAAQARRKGLGALMMRLALSHALVEEDLLADPEVRIVAHVLKSNPAPRTIIEEQLRFRLARTVEIPTAELPGLRADDDGLVRGDEFEIALPESLVALAEWAEGWSGRLADDEAADIEFRPGMTMQDWAGVLRRLATDRSAV